MGISHFNYINSLAADQCELRKIDTGDNSIKRLVADFLGVPTGVRLRQLRNVHKVC
jgi:hypothetical protein